MSKAKDTTMNEEFFDALVRHQIYLLRYSGSIRNKINAILQKTEADIADRIRSRLLENKGLDTAGYRKLLSLQEYIKTVRYKSWDEIDALWISQAQELAKKEPVFTAAALNITSPVVLLDLKLPAPALLKSIVTSKPMEGRTLKQWSASIAQADVERINQQVAIGMTQGESSAAIARRITGTAALNGSDGVTQITRNQAEAITRTMVNHISNSARQEFYQDNSDIIDEELFVATLDSRTTPVCRANDGKRFPLGIGPIPPLHMSCRSLRVAIISPDAIGSRPYKASTESQLLGEFADDNNLEDITSYDDIPYGMKGQYNTFAAQRVKEMTGTVPANVTYQQWLTRQSASFQDNALGKTKGKLFRNGKLQLDKFVNKAGDELTLSELAAQHASAFTDAGLDPANFLN